MSNDSKPLPVIQKLKLLRAVGKKSNPPKDADPLKPLFSQLRAVLVSYIGFHHMPTLEEELWQLIDALADEIDNTPTKKLDRMLRRATEAASPKSRKEWKAVLLGSGKHIVERAPKMDKVFGIKVVDTDDMRTRVPRITYEFASLLLDAHDIRSSVTRIPIDGSTASEISKEVYEQADHSVTPIPQAVSARVVVQLTHNAENDRTQYSVALDGDCDGWYLAFMKAKRDKRALPHTDVLVIASPTEIYLPLSSENKYVLTEGVQLREFESWISWQYRLSADELIAEICRIAIQYCSFYYKTPYWIGVVVAGVLSSFWDRAELHTSKKVIAVFNDQISIPLTIAKEELKIRTLGGYEDSKKNSGYVATSLDLAVWYNYGLIIRLVIPAIIARWLEGNVGLDPELFFEPRNWHFVWEQ